MSLLQSGKMPEFKDQDPQIYFNGEPASEEDITVMEKMALALANSIPVTITRSYAYYVGETFLIAQTMHDTDPGCETKHSSIILLDQSQTRLELVFDDKNDLNKLGISEDEDLDELDKLVQTFLDSEHMDQEERAVAQHIQKMLRALQCETAEEVQAYMGQLSSDARSRVTDIIWQHVEAKTTVALHTREFGMLLEGYILNIITQEVVGDTSDEETEDYPPIQLALTDEETSITYVYERTHGGHAVMNSTDGFEEFEDDAETEEDEEVEELKRELGLNKPAKDEIALITEKLIDAGLVDLLA